ncbi:MAG: hypothetical protein ACTSQY_10125 [Candidatus Odinarchaeia archaeon]
MDNSHTEPKTSVKQIFVITDSGKLIYYKSFIDNGGTPEVIAGFFSAFSSFFKEAFKSDIQELVISEFKLFFFKIDKDIITIVLSDPTADKSDIELFAKYFSTYIKDLIKKRNPDALNINYIQEEVNKKLPLILKKGTREKTIKSSPPKISIYRFLVTKIKRGLPSLLKAINIEGKIAILGRREKVSEFISFLRGFLVGRPYLEIIEYSEDFTKADIIGLPHSKRGSIPEEYLIVDLDRGVVESKEKCDPCMVIFKKLESMSPEEQYRVVSSMLEDIVRTRERFMQLLSEEKIEEAKKILLDYDPIKKKLVIDNIIYNNIILRILKEYRRYLPVDIILSFDSRLFFFEDNIFFSGKLDVNKEILFIEELYRNAAMFLGEKKAEEINNIIRDQFL